MELSGKNVCVVGTGISGMGAVGLLNEADAHVYLYDGNTKLEKSKVLEKLGTKKADIIIGEMPKEVLDVLDLAVISPGVPIDSDIVLEFNNAGIPVWGEIELAYNYGKGRVIAITGTNGKTTTATLSFNLFSSLGLKCGLISTIVNKIGDKDYPTERTTPDVLSLNELLSDMVASGCEFVFMEVSSHAVVQQRIAGLSFSGAVFSNITHDHLDYHKTFANYIKAKKALFDMLPKEAFALTNIDDRNGEKMLEDTKARKYSYSLRFKHRKIIIQNKYKA